MTTGSNDRHILFITRKWHGHGGMQRLSRDLDRELSRLYGARYSCVRPSAPGMAGLIGFVPRAVAAGIRCGKAGGYVHLGDAALLPLGVLIRRVSGAVLSVTACGLDVLYPSAVYQWVLRGCMRHARIIVCISEATARAVRERGVDPANVIVIPCGITAEEVSPGTQCEPHLLLTVGRLVPRKGVAWFIEYALPGILMLHPDVRYIVAGSGPEESRIRQLIAKNNLQSVVELHTDCDNDARDALMRRAEVFVMPNIPVPGNMEGFGIVAIEAAARGLPVCAARIDGIPDAVLEEKTGRFFVAGDAQDCASVLSGMLSRPLQSADVAHHARGYYSWSRLITLYRTHVFS